MPHQDLEIASNAVLTAREDEVAYWNALGKSNEEIGCILGISSETVKVHLKHICEKLNVYNRTAVVTEAFRQGILKFACVFLSLTAQASIEIHGVDAARPRQPTRIRLTRNTRRDGGQDCISLLSEEYAA